MAATKRERRDRREELSDAAIATFFAKGYAATSIQDIAEVVGILKGSIYHYIDSKEDLLEWIFETAIEDNQSRMDAISELDLPPTERLAEFVTRQIEWLLTHLEHSAVLYREWPYLEGDRRRTMARHRHAYENFVRGLIEDCRDVGVLDPDVDILHALRFILGAVEATLEWYRPDGPEPPERVAKVYAELTLGALVGTHRSS